jgi:hypothetical protein
MNDGGPAFPTHGYFQGLSMLDYFAGQALIGLLSQTGHTEDGHTCAEWSGDREDRRGLTNRAYAIAEQMLVVRKVIAEEKPVFPA